jgi:hypothetical protein
MSVWGGENFVTEAQMYVRVVAPGVGVIFCPECGGNQERYRSLFPPEIGVKQCVDCKGTGLVCVSV